MPQLRGHEGLKVHVTKDLVYFGNAQDGAISEAPAASFSCQGIGLEDAENIYVLGLPQNAAVLVRLYEWTQNHEWTGAFFVGGPLPPAKRKVSTALGLFRRMEQMDYGASGCGWHRFTKYDYHTYNLVAELQKETHAPGIVEQLVRLHPAWPVFNFVHAYNFEPISQLLTEIIDPRWHFDPASAEILPRLTERVFFKGEGRKFDGDLLLRSWLGNDYAQKPSEGLMTGTHGLMPHDVLYRVARLALDAPNGPLPWKDLVCPFLLRWLVEVWLDEVTPTRQLFVPEHAFQPWPDVLVAWRKFRKHRAKDVS